MRTVTCDCGETFPATTGIATAVGNQPLRSHPTCPVCGAAWIHNDESGQSWPAPADDADDED